MRGVNRRPFALHGPIFPVTPGTIAPGRTNACSFRARAACEPSIVGSALAGIATWHVEGFASRRAASPGGRPVTVPFSHFTCPGGSFRQAAKRPDNPPDACRAAGSGFGEDKTWTRGCFCFPMGELPHWPPRGKRAERGLGAGVIGLAGGTPALLGRCGTGAVGGYAGGKADEAERGRLRALRFH